MSGGFLGIVMPGLVPGVHVFCRSTKDVDGRDKPGHDAGGDYAPGRSRMRFATMPSITSDVPPSIELALVRSQARGRAPPRERSLSHSSASMPPADIRISWRRLFSSVP